MVQADQIFLADPFRIVNSLESQLRHDFKCIWAARNRPMTACKMLGAVYRSWFINVPALKKQFANKAPDVDLNDDERALMAANIQAYKHN